jgi:ABC-type dipeptide/oligopeptide/nickel transport system ATPase subunit
MVRIGYRGLGDEMIEIQDMTKLYQMGEMAVRALNGVSPCADEGEWFGEV